MCRSTEPREERDGGFLMVEVVVALGMITLLLVALLPQLVVGIRSSAKAEALTQAKGVAQGQLERMRNMPYHVARAAGPYLDVLDRYYTNRTAAPAVTCTDGDDYRVPTTSWSGYVSASAAQCDYEPATGAFYRYVVPHPASGADPNAGFDVVVTTQFLDGATPPSVVEPVATYDTQVAGRDFPASSQIGVTVTVFERGTTLRPVTTYTQIADLPDEISRVRVAAQATAVEIGSVLDAQGAVSLEAGLLDLTGSLAFASEAGADLTAVSGGLATGEQQAGAASTVTAPSTAAVVPGFAGCLSTFACWGASQLDVGATSATSGLPNAGSAASPMQARVTDAVLTFDNGGSGDYRPALDLDGPLVRMTPGTSSSATGVTSSCAPGTAGMPAYVRSSGFVRTTAASDATAPSTVEACALSSASSMSLFPTTFAPDGVVQVELVRASTRCVVSGAGHTAQAPTVDYRAVVRYHVGSDPDTYETAAVITPASTSDVLAAFDLTTDVDGALGDHTLGDYVATWSGLVGAAVESSHVGGRAEARLPGVVQITSTPVRGTEVLPTVTPEPTPVELPTASASPGVEPSENASASPTATATATAEPTPTETPEPQEVIDPTSAFTFTAGIVACSAEDAR